MNNIFNPRLKPHEDEVLIWLKKDNHRFIIYKSDWTWLPEDTEVVTIMIMKKDELEKVKNETFEEVEKILSKYI